MKPFFLIALVTSVFFLGCVDPAQQGACTVTSIGTLFCPSITSSSRNVLLQPFSSNSIWNTSIGSNATYVAANITVPGHISPDEDVIILTPSAPLVPLEYNSAAWQGGVGFNRCDFTTWPVTPVTGAVTHVPIPSHYSLPSAPYPNTPNNAGTILLADGRSLQPIQPMQVCTPGGPVTFKMHDQEAVVDIYSDGTYGSHGGSGLSGIGGTIRVGELVPGNSEIVNGVQNVMRHALKFEFNTGVLSNFAQEAWPAKNNDGANEGLLVALLPSFNYNALKSAPGRSIAWTLINYGAYLVDNSAWDDIAICTEQGTTSMDGTANSVVNDFSKDWGVAFTQNLTSAAGWAADIKTIMANLQVITNNSATSVGGGGAPLQPLLPEVHP